jgi:Putative auto-transporter adhesin, head GIN domain
MVGCLALIGPVGCNASIGPMVIGSGNSATEDRTVGGFHALNVQTAIRATVSIGSPQRVTVTADDNVLSMVSTTVSNGELKLAMQGSVTTRTPVQVDIVVPALDSLSASSAARLEATGLTADALSVNVESAGTLSATGKASSLDVSVASSGSAELSGVPVQTVHANIASAGHATVNASSSVSGTVDSAGLLTINGNPSDVSVDTNAAGRVERK